MLRTKRPCTRSSSDSDGESKKSIWVRIGIAFLNRDGSYNVKLDALPMNGTLQVRDWPPPNEWPRRESSAPANSNANLGGGRSHADIFAGA